MNAKPVKSAAGQSLARLLKAAEQGQYRQMALQLKLLVEPFVQRGRTAFTEEDIQLAYKFWCRYMEIKDAPYIQIESRGTHACMVLFGTSADTERKLPQGVSEAGDLAEQISKVCAQLLAGLGQPGADIENTEPRPSFLRIVR